MAPISGCLRAVFSHFHASLIINLQAENRTKQKVLLPEGPDFLGKRLALTGGSGDVFL